MHVRFRNAWYGALTILLLVSGATVTIAGPRVIEEQARVQLPGPIDQLVTGLAIDGDYMIVSANRIYDEPPGTTQIQGFAYLFERTPQNEWRYATTLVTEQALWQDAVVIRVALEANVAAVESNDLRIFERTAAGEWTQSATLPSPSNHYMYGGSVKIDGGTVLTGGPDCAWQAYRKNALSQWTQVAAATDPSADAYCFAWLDISGSTVASGLSNWISGAPSALRIYDDLASTPTATLQSPFGNDPYFGVTAAIRGDTLATVASLRKGVQIFRRDTSGVWQFAQNAYSSDAFVNEQGYNISVIDVSDEFLVGAYPFDSQRAHAAGSVPVFRKSSNGSFSQVARLLASDARPDLVLGTYVAIGGRRVAASAGYERDAAVYVFELPTDFTQPTNVQDDFEASNFARWSALAGSSFSVVPKSRSRVLRQSSLAGDAGAYLTNMDWTDQSIQADVRATAFQGSNRWFGLVVRRTDLTNYYYLTVRSSNVVQLRRIVNGQFEVLASAPLAVATNRDYRLRLEAVGTWIRGYVNGQLMVEARDSTHTRGQAGIQMYRASAEYDNVLVTPNPLLTIASDHFNMPPEPTWTVVDGSWQSWVDGTRYLYRQTSIAGDGRTVSGVVTSDQIIQVDARAKSFANSNAWFGVMGRYVDPRNYYYVTMRNNGTVSLRKLVNGTINVLDTANLPVARNVWNRVRLEIVGTALRVYVDDRIVLQARDSSFASGRYGLVTYQAIADYEDLAGYEP